MDLDVEFDKNLKQLKEQGMIRSLVKGDLVAYETDTCPYSKLQINTDNHQPICVVQNKVLSNEKKNELLALVNNQMSRGFLIPSESKWNSPVSLRKVAYKSADPSKETIRNELYVNFSKLNSITKDQTTLSIPSKHEFFNLITDSSCFSKFVIAGGVKHLRLDKNSSDKTSFSIGNKKFQFLTFQPSLKNANKYLQKYLELCIFHSRLLLDNLNPNETDLIRNSIKIYLDTVIVHTTNSRNHKFVLNFLITIFLRNKIKINEPHSTINAEEITFLGRIFNSKGMCIHSDIKKEIASYPMPLNRDDLKKFANRVGDFRDFISIWTSPAVVSLSSQSKSSHVTNDTIQTILDLKAAVQNSGFIKLRVDLNNYNID